MTTRERLPDRRESDLIEVEHVWRGPHGDVAETVLVTIGRHPDGRIGEIFLDYPPREGERRKAERVMALADDFAVVVSIALQYGAPLDVLRHAISREEVIQLGKLIEVPSTILGSVLDAVAMEGE